MARITPDSGPSTRIIPDRSSIWLGTTMRGAMWDNDEIARLDLHLLIAEPDRSRAFEDVLHFIGSGMQVLRDIAVLHRNRAAFARSKHLGTEADGVRRAERISNKVGQVNNLHLEILGIGTRGGLHQLRHSAAGGEGNRNRDRSSHAVHGFLPFVDF